MIRVPKRLLFLLVPLLAACNDGLGPDFWDSTPDTLSLFSASRDEYVAQFSAIDLVSQPISRLPIEAPGLTGNWDFALAEEDGDLVLLPAAAIPAVNSRARIGMILNRSFDDITEAPRDTAAYSASAVPVRADAVYVVRTRRAACGFTTGYRYAKLVPIEIDVDAGTLRFAVVRNPYCDNRSFVPPT